MKGQTKKRKGEHIQICLKKDVSYQHNYFDDIQFEHDALTELDYGQIDTSSRFLRHHLQYPFMVSAITGGYDEAMKINKGLAKACEKYGIAFGLGSQRAMLEDKSLTKTYSVRDVAPTIPVVGNIGAAQLASYKPVQINDMLKDVKADYLAIHLNTLQELIQPEGDRDFNGLEERINIVVREIEFPVILKETGAGITRTVVDRIVRKGIPIEGIDVAGSGGTSWAKVEGHRGGDVGQFSEWGSPTPICTMEVARTGMFTIASGGIRTGLDAAKALSLGANIAGGARVFVEAYFRKRLEQEIECWITGLKRAMMLTNSRHVRDLQSANLIITGKAAQYVHAKGIRVAHFANRR
ncbi:MAG: type 2 isopentenyl-diphosphate Delta-isomerase [Candidatus Micrarchaeota archaeon]|nr:type 2 isopentenyl-diphosphate Delta-isomerase [Candidatus Micrarchaeota archaeon]